jgi:ABC-type Fe3+-siderophore transport system permease subunit
VEDVLVMPFSNISPVWIAIFAILGAFAAGIVAMVLRSKEKERVHNERMFLAEKGMEIPKELYASPKPNKDKKPGHFRAARAWLIVLGTTMLFIGVAVMIALTISEGISTGINGITPALIGVGFLIAERMLGRFAKQSKRESDLAQ